MPYKQQIQVKSLISERHVKYIILRIFLDEIL